MQLSEGPRGAAALEDAPEHKGWYKWYVAALLASIVAFAYVDRYIPFILAEDIKAELGLSDSQIGLIGGLAFALFNTVFMLPVSVLADRTSRKWVISISVAVWSAMTALGGLAQNFLHLFLVRSGVGLGEAGVLPAAQSTIAARFPARQRATALSLLSVGVTIGIMLGYGLGGYLADQIGWRMAYMAVGVPGVLIALLVVFTLRDPPKVVAPTKASFSEVGGAARAIVSTPTLKWIVLGVSFHVLASQGLSAWLAPFLMRVHDVSATEAGLLIGLPAGLMGGLGALFGGVFTDWLVKRDVRWYLWLPAIAVLGCVPIYSLAFYAPTTTLFLAAFLPGLVFSVAYTAPFFAMVQNLAHPARRAIYAALVLLVVSLVGGAGAAMVGALSDAFAPLLGEESLRPAMLISNAINILSCVCLVWGARTAREDLASARAQFASLEIR